MTTILTDTNQAYKDGYDAGYEQAFNDLDWKYFLEEPPRKDEDLLVVYYVNDTRHLGVSWGNWEQFEREILDSAPGYKLHAYRYLLEPKP